MCLVEESDCVSTNVETWETVPKQRAQRWYNDGALKGEHTDPQLNESTRLISRQASFKCEVWLQAKAHLIKLTRRKAMGHKHVRRRSLMNLLKIRRTWQTEQGLTPEPLERFSHPCDHVCGLKQAQTSFAWEGRQIKEKKLPSQKVTTNKVHLSYMYKQMQRNSRSEPGKQLLCWLQTPAGLHLKVSYIKGWRQNYHDQLKHYHHHLSYSSVEKKLMKRNWIYIIISCWPNCRTTTCLAAALVRQKPRVH